MKKKKIDEEIVKKIRDISHEVIEVFHRNDTDVMTTCAILGGVMAHFALLSDEAAPYLSFLQSFSHTVDCIHKCQVKEAKLKDS